MSSIDAIVSDVARAFTLTPDELIGRRKFPYLSDARSELAYRLWRETDLTMAAIGQAMGGRHYRTVAYYLERRSLREPVAA